MVSANQQSGEYYEEHEIQQQLLDMDQVQITRLWKSYELSGSEERAGMTGGDVLGAVVKAALTPKGSKGHRGWKRDLPLEVYFRMTGKSIFDNESNKRANQGILPETGDVLEQPEIGAENPDLDIYAPTQSADKTAQEIQSTGLISAMTEKIFQLFSDDTEALCYLQGKLDECKKQVIIERCQFTDKIYRNVQSRIKDKVLKRFPNGLTVLDLDS